MDYNSPKLTTDGAIIKDSKILLVKRKNEPFKGKWALPGGFVEYGEKVEDAVIREVKEETGLVTKIKEFIGIYSDPNRDPRGHTVTIVFLLEIIDGKLNAKDDADDVKFFNLNKLPNLSFDHNTIIEDVIRRMKNNVLSKM
jgi:8-oxo-dGTP diphosphatase